MKLLSSPLPLIALGVCIILHILSALLPKKAASILAYVNIGLHIVLVLLSAFAALPIEEAVLLYLISLFVYTHTAAISNRCRLARVKSAEAEFEARREEGGV